ncbi:MAG: PorP/SprF family type IX secretion system membrane protein [Chitinophagales bacterium]
MIKRILKSCFYVLFMGFRILFAQQEPQFSQYMQSPLVFNPATAGMEDALVNVLAARSQWVQIPGAPQSQIITAHMPVYRLQSGIGLRFVNNQSGQLQTTAVSFAYAWHQSFKESIISIGVFGGIAYQDLDGSKLIAPQGSYEGIIDHNDNNLPESFVSDIIPDAGLGLYFQGQKVQFGIFALHIIGQAFQYNTTSEITSIQYAPVGYVYLGYNQKVGANFHLKPTVLYKTDLIESMADVNLLLDYKNLIFLGTSYRGYLNEQTDAVAIIAGWNISEKLGISYSYDITLSKLSAVSQGSHEFVLAYRIPMQRPRAGKQINNPRYIYY